MKRLGMFIVLMAISSSANAGSYSFVIGGRHIHIEAPRNCRSSTCVSVSSSGERKRDDGVIAPVTAPASPPAPAAMPAPAPVVAPAPAPACAPAAAPVKPAAPMIVAAPPPAAPALASTTAQDVTLPPLPKLEPPKFELPKTSSLKPPPPVKADITTVSQRTEDDPVDLPLGQWETAEGKGTVRIERCGTALCG